MPLVCKPLRNAILRPSTLWRSTVVDFREECLPLRGRVQHFFHARSHLVRHFGLLFDETGEEHHVALDRLGALALGSQPALKCLCIDFSSHGANKSPYQGIRTQLHIPTSPRIAHFSL